MNFSATSSYEIRSTLAGYVSAPDPNQIRSGYDLISSQNASSQNASSQNASSQSEEATRANNANNANSTEGNLAGATSISSQRIKIVVFGPPRTGKSQWVNYLSTGERRQFYTPTIGINVRRVVIEGKNIDLWDTAGDENFEDLGDGYYIGANAGVAFYDPNCRESCQIVRNMLRNFRRITNAPVVTVTNLDTLWENPTQPLRTILNRL
jgi:GTPase SAR1 family protein